MIAQEARPEVESKLRKVLWQCFFAGLCAAICIHLLFGMLFKPMPRAAKQSVEAVRRTVMVNPSQLAADDRLGLLNVLKYGDPTLFAKPDERFGFSSYRMIRQPDAALPPDLPPEPNGLFSALSIGAPDLSTRVPGSELPPPASWLHFVQLVDSMASESSAQASLSAHIDPPLWLDASFKPVARLADQHGDIARLLAANAGKPLSSTVVVVRGSGPDLPPSVDVFESCGVRALDAAAARSLSVSIESMPQEMLPHGGEASVLILKWTASSQVRVKAEGPAK